jgi:hypothetical protein
MLGELREEPRLVVARPIKNEVVEAGLKVRLGMPPSGRSHTAALLVVW